MYSHIRALAARKAAVRPKHRQWPTGASVCVWGLLACFAMATACTRTAKVTFYSGQPLTVRKQALYPETIEYDAQRKRFLLGSFRDGAIYEVDAAGGARLVIDDVRLCSVLGIAIDSKRNRLWAVSSNLGASRRVCSAGPKQVAAVGVYNLTTGAPLNFIELAPLAQSPHLANGIALDKKGHAYVTDSFAQAIYKVDGAGQARLFVQDARLGGEGINLNGVVVHPDGYLLVIKKSTGQLFKIPLDRPQQLSQVALDTSLVGGDGLTLIENKTLMVIANQTPDAASNAAFSLSSDDGWRSAKLREKHPLGVVYPTTAVLHDGTISVVHSKLNELIQASPDTKSNLKTEATIQPIARVSP